MSDLVSISQQASEISELLTGRLNECYPGLLERESIEQYIRYLDEAEYLSAYHFFPLQALQLFIRLRSYGLTAVADYHRLSLTTLISQSEKRVKKHNIPDSVEARLVGAYKKILSKILTANDKAFGHDKDLFCKDLTL